MFSVTQLLKTFWQSPTTFSDSATKTPPPHILCWYTKPKTLYWNSRTSNFSNSSCYFITAGFLKCCSLCKTSLPHLTTWQRPVHLLKLNSDDFSSFVIFQYLLHYLHSKPHQIVWQLLILWFSLPWNYMFLYSLCDIVSGEIYVF